MLGILSQIYKFIVTNLFTPFNRMTNKNTPTKKPKVLIIENDISSAKDITLRLFEMNYDVIAFTLTAVSSLKLIQENNDIDVIIMETIIKDNQDGIELAKIIKEQYNIPIIFLTSNTDQHIVKRAKSVQPNAYIIKPFQDEQVNIAIELALLDISQKPPSLVPKQKANNNQVIQIKNSLFLKKNSLFKRVSLDEILFIQADNNYSTVYTKTEKFVYSIVMKKIEDQLPKDLFLRAHRSYIVNVNAIDGFEGNMLFVKKSKIPISRSYKQDVFKLFKTIYA